MAAGQYNFTIEQGTTTDFEIQYKDSGSNPVDFAGYEASMSISTTLGGDLIASITSSEGDVYAKESGVNFLSLSGSNLTTPVASGSIGVYIGHQITDTFTFDEAYYDIELTTGEARTRILQGKVKLSKDVS